MEKIDLRDSLSEFLQLYKKNNPTTRISILVDYNNIPTHLVKNTISVDINTVLLEFFKNGSELSDLLYGFYKNIINMFLEYDSVYVINNISVTYDKLNMFNGKFFCEYYSVENNDKVLDWLFFN